MLVMSRSARTLRSMAELVSVAVERRARVHASGWAAGVGGRAGGTRPAAGVSCVHTLQPFPPHTTFSNARPLSRSQTNRASGEHAVGIRSVAQKSFLYGHSGRPGIQKEPTVAHHPRAPHMK